MQTICEWVVQQKTATMVKQWWWAVPLTTPANDASIKEEKTMDPAAQEGSSIELGSVVNPEYGISIESIRVTDYGNVGFEEKGVSDKNNIPEACIEVIAKEVFSLLEIGGVPFVLGGSKESLFGSALAFHRKHGTSSHHILISGKPSLSPAIGDKLTSDNALTLLNKSFPNTITLFSSHQQHFPAKYPTHLFQNIPYETIRKQSFNQTPTLYTQAGSVFNHLLSTLQGSIHVSLTVQSIERFRGCRDVLSQGLTEQQILQIFLVIGRSEKVKLVDISEFNPSVEDYQSSLLIVNLLYYFLMGWTIRHQSK